MNQTQVPVVYSAAWCGPCGRLKRQLDDLRLRYTVVDVDAHPEALAQLEEINGGSWIIPTVAFADGSALVNPSAAAVAARCTGPDT